MTILSVLVILGVIFLLSFLVESLVETIFSPFFDRVPALQPYKWLMMYAAMILAVVGAFLYGFDLLYLLGNYLAAEFKLDQGLPIFAAPTWYGILLTGLAIGKGSNYLHDVISKFFTKPKSPEAAG